MPTYSKNCINKKIKSAKNFECMETLKDAEEFFLKKRKYVIKKPQKNEAVILPFTGGLDSTSLCYLLLEEFEMTVYPVFRSGKKSELFDERSAVFFHNLFRKKYKNKLKELFYLPHTHTHAEFQSTFYEPIETNLFWINYFFLPKQIIDYVEYAYHLQALNGIKIRNIFLGYVSSDTELKQDQTLTSTRSIMQFICQITNDFSWQISPIFLEKEFGFFHSKKTIIKWANKQGIPIELTRSCSQPTYYNCGDCDVCMLRKKSFADAKTKDRTIYENTLPFYKKIINKLRIELGK